MSRVPKWKGEKAKVKVVFRLQFHATHIPQPGWDKLVVSFIPFETGKQIAKTTKANVKNGNCKWSDPIYETTRLTQEPRTKRYEEKLYKLVVTMGSPRSGLLGEVNINLADFADASKPSSVELPLHGCEFGTILHVTVQLLTSKTGFREFEQQRELTVKGIQMITGHRNHNPAEMLPPSSDTAREQIDKVNARVRFKEDSAEVPSLEEAGEANEDYEDSAVGIDGSSCTSGSLYAEKNDISNMHELDSFKSTTSVDIGVFPLGPSPNNGREQHGDKRLSTQGSNDSNHGWSSDYSGDNDLTAAYEENNRLRVRVEVAESAFLQLKSEAKSLQTVTDELGVETQRLTQHLATELVSGEKLSREVSILKSECSNLKSDLQDLRSAKQMQHFPDRSHFPRDLVDASFNDKLEGNARASGQPYAFCDIQHDCLQGLLLIDGKIQEIQNKAYHGSNFELLRSDFEVIEFLLQNHKQAITHWTSSELLHVNQLKEIQTTRILHPEQHHHHQDMHRFLSLGEEMRELQERLEESKIENGSLSKKIGQMECYYEALIRDIEESQKHTVIELENIRSEHASCLYAISAHQSQMEKMQQEMNEQLIGFAEERHCLDSLNKELEKRAITSETALKRVRKNYSIAVDRLQKDLEILSFQVLSMYETNENLAKHAFTDASPHFFQQFPAEHSEEVKSGLLKDDVLLYLHKEQLKPTVATIQSESRLKINHGSCPMLNGASEKVSYQPVHEFDLIKENSSISQIGVPMNVEQMKDANIVPANGLLLDDIGQVVSETQRNIALNETSIPMLNNEFRETDSIDTLAISNQYAEPHTLTLEGKNGLEEMRLSLHMLKELQLDTEGELLEMHMLNLYLEVFSEVLRETLRGVYSGIEPMKDHMDKLTQQLAHSTEIQESVTLRLHTAFGEVGTLRENEAKLTSEANALTLKNNSLEKKLQDVLKEKTCFIQKVAENERMLMEYKVFENKFMACSKEREELENLLKQETVENSCLHNEMSCINEDFKALKEQFDKQSLVIDGLQNTSNLLQEKLEDLFSTMISCNEQINGSTFDGISLQQELECKNYVSMVLHLKQFQQEACKAIVELRHQKKEIEEQGDVTKYSLSKKETQISYMVQKFESELKSIEAKLDFSYTVTEKLQVELQDVVEKLKISSVAEEEQGIRNRDLLSKLTVCELELHHANCEKEDLDHRLLLLEGVNEDLERMKTSYMNCVLEKNTLSMSIQSGNESSIQIENELNSLKESLRCTHDELQLEKKFREEHEAAITDLTSQMKEKNQQLLSFNEQKVELAQLRKRILDLKTENIRLQQLVLQSDEIQRKLDGEKVSLCFEAAEIKNHLAAALEYSLTTDVERTYMTSHFRHRVQELSAEFHDDLEDMRLKHLDLVASLRMSKVDGEQLAEENERLSKALKSMKFELDTITFEKNALVDCVNKTNTISTEAENMMVTIATMEAENDREKQEYIYEILQLKNLLTSFEEEVDNLRSSRYELEITDIVLGSKLNEQQTQLLLLEACADEYKMLKGQHDELSYKLSEQILKTEEFKNLSFHLRELKDKADAECYQAREKRVSEGPSHPMQESLRIAFIKEQYESKIQELTNQLDASKKHAEEMLLKLQNALDEVESRNRSEVSLARKNEELAPKILDLETELQAVMTGRREVVKAYDRTKAELECAILSLDCCKEEKLKLEVSLQECSEERTKIMVELDLVKRMLENMASITDMQAQRDLEPCSSNTSIGQLLKETTSAELQCRGKDIITAADVDIMDGNPCEEVNHIMESSHSCLQPNLQTSKDGLVSRDVLKRESFSDDSRKQITDIKEHFQEHQKLKASMSQLQKELERLKNENLSSLLPLEDNYFDPALQGLQRELTQLDMANEHLGSMFPLFKELPVAGNALERVLALELELAETLQAKNKSNTLLFQSSFTRQHKSEEAVYQSFRDINDLINDMLELKRRNGAVEVELKEMQGRYSQLSLQFAEVEGERQKLVMTLKNRSPKRS